MRLIADKVLKPIASDGLPGAWYRGRRLMSFDGTCFDTPDEAENASYFGRPGPSGGRTASPRARVLALVETGTLAVTAAEIAPCGTGEEAMALKLIGRGKLAWDMLLLADVALTDCRLWAAADDTCAKLVWRAGSGLGLAATDALPDGSSICLMRGDRDGKAGSRRVRVIEYEPAGADPGPGAGRAGEERRRLVTNILDHESAPAEELAALHHEHREIGDLYGEFLKGPHAAGTILRSKTPDLVIQELWGLLLVHFALRELMAEPAWQAKPATDGLSPKGAVRVIRS
jgi:hypothetical protein